MIAGSGSVITAVITLEIMHGSLDIELPADDDGCELCRMFCSWAKWIRGARAEVLCPTCSRTLADGGKHLTDRSLDNSIIQLLPESVAREINSLGYCMTDSGMVCFSDLNRPDSFETTEKLRFILNRKMYNFHANGNVIARAIDHYYGTES